LKPMVLTLHDPFFLGGHCVHSGDCEKYKSFCADCEHLQIQFALKEDLTSYYFMKKSVAIQNSNLPVIVASQWMEERAKSSPIFAHQKIYCLPFGIDLDVFCPRDSDTAKKALGIPQGSLTIMFRADANPFKGLEVVLNALDKISSDRPITLISVGQNNLMNEYKQKYQTFEFGWITEDKELAKLYQACDIFLMPSKQEAFGMMAIEAMACEKPVLVLEGTALPAVVHSPECGLAVCEAEFANTLQFWLEHPQECLERGKKSLAYAQAHYGIEQYTDGMLRIYAEVMASFTPDPHAETVLSQMLQASLNHASCAAAKATSLSDSHSW
ncbi:MAG: glycosyltransferase, partial [Clostridia bacterium]